MRETHDAELSGRTAVVTGAAQGIGYAIARRLAVAGAAVTLTDINETKLDEATERLRSEGLAVFAAAADLTRESDVAAMIEASHAHWGSLDIVVANAGRMTHGGALSNDQEAFETGLRMNLVSAYLTARAAMPRVQGSPRGRIILMGSMAGSDPRTVTGIAYAVSKAAISHLAGILAVELTGTSTTVNAIAPSAVLTDMSSAFGDEVLAAFAARSPLGRIATPEDIADVALFLASDLGSFVNGQTVRVSGGP
jgi:NAD(P)-dependent dehydrogenase (short-subunit alcohol dehydrogenase family)